MSDNETTGREPASWIRGMVGRERLAEMGRAVMERARSKWIGLAVTAALFVGLFLWLGATAAVFISLFALLYVLRIEGRVSVAAGIAALVVCAALLMAGSKDQAETWACWAFYFFLIGITLQFIELRREMRKTTAIDMDECVRRDEDRREKSEDR